MFIEKTLEKFNTDKTYKYFPGNTIVEFISDNTILETIIEMKDKYIASKVFEKFIFLPIESYHMTVCDLITFNDLQTNPAFENFIFKNDEAIDVIDQKILAKFDKELFNLNVKMKAVKIKAKQIMLEPKTVEDEIKLREFRSKVEKVLKIRLNPNYKFHISLTYQLKQLTPNEETLVNDFLEKLNVEYLEKLATIEINTPILIAFNDMSEYRLLSKGRNNLGYNKIK